MHEPRRRRPRSADRSVRPAGDAWEQRQIRRCASTTAAGRSTSAVCAPSQSSTALRSRAAADAAPEQRPAPRGGGGNGLLSPTACAARAQPDRGGPAPEPTLERAERRGGSFSSAMQAQAQRQSAAQHSRRAESGQAARSRAVTTEAGAELDLAVPAPPGARHLYGRQPAAGTQTAARCSCSQADPSQLQGIAGPSRSRRSVEGVPPNYDPHRSSISRSSNNSRHGKRAFAALSCLQPLSRRVRHGSR